MNQLTTLWRQHPLLLLDALATSRGDRHYACFVDDAGRIRFRIEYDSLEEAQDEIDAAEPPEQVDEIP
jgi:hypothetical protein